MLNKTLLHAFSQNTLNIKKAKCCFWQTEEEDKFAYDNNKLQFFLTLPLTGVKLPLAASILPLKLMAMFVLVIAIWMLLLAMNVLVIDT